MSRTERRHARLLKQLKARYNKHPTAYAYTGSKGSDVNFKKKKSLVSAKGKQTRRK